MSSAEFKLSLDPSDKICFSGKKLGEESVTASVKLTNPTKDRQAFKIKCTSNEMFRIRPPVGVLKAGECQAISLIFNGSKTVPDANKHYFAFYHVKVDDEKKAARAVWTDHKGDPDGTKKLFVDFKKEEDKATAGDEKKDEEKKEEKKEEEKKDEKKEEKKDEKKEEKKNEKKDEEKKDDKKDEKKDEKK